MGKQEDFVLRALEERDVRFVRLWFTDVLGNLKSFAISPAELENALEDGMTFDGSSIDGFSRIQRRHCPAPSVASYSTIATAPACSAWSACTAG